MCIFTKFSHQEVSSNYGILRSDWFSICLISFQVHWTMGISNSNDKNVSSRTALKIILEMKDADSDSPTNSASSDMETDSCED